MSTEHYLHRDICKIIKHRLKSWMMLSKSLQEFTGKIKAEHHKMCVPY